MTKYCFFLDLIVKAKYLLIFREDLQRCESLLETERGLKTSLEDTIYKLIEDRVI